MFDTWAESKEIHVLQWGLNRPPFQFVQYLSEEIRWTPDRLCEDTQSYVKDHYHANLHRHFLAEVKAVGKDQIVKIKTRHIPVLQRAQEFNKRRVLFFIFDSANNRISISHDVEEIAQLSQYMKVNEFYDGGTYFEFPTDTFIWEPIDANTNSDT